MMDYIVSARKYRPMTFDSVVGQSSLTITLKNAVKSGKLAHAFLFCGPRGVGKTTCARIFAKAINCQNPSPDGEACNECESCRSFNEQRSMNIFELDAASNNGVDDIRDLIQQTLIPPQTGKYKVFIIDEVHMLSQAAFNAFLKTLEEPPSYVIFILATTEKHKLLPTIISRCQIYDFERMSVADTINHLKMVAEKEGITYEEEALNIIAEKADGGMRDALSIFDQCASFSQNNLTYAKVIENLNVLDAEYYFKIVDLAIDNKVSDVMLLLNDVITKGFDGGHLVNGLAAHIRNVMMAKDEKTLKLLETSARHRERYQEQAKRCPDRFLYKALRLTNRCDMDYRQSSNKRLLVELTLIEIAQITQEDDSEGAGRRPARRLKTLFKKLVPASRQQATQQVAASGQTAQTITMAPVGTNPAATTPAVTPQKPMVKPPVLNLSQITHSFDKLRNEPKDTVYQRVDERVDIKENKPFTQEDLEREWLAMCMRMPQPMHGLASRLKNVKPRITDYPNIELVVDNQSVQSQVAAISGRIRATMAKALNNGEIQFTVRLAAIEEVGKVLSKRELFAQLREQNPAIDRLSTLLDLEVS
ncbi:MAG: DNA polymerase III subunit gamma/tau [Prevotella sp.]|nr:DNA polymerase III subunit gamma/tau [Prevotella sp.]